MPGWPKRRLVDCLGFKPPVSNGSGAWPGTELALWVRLPSLIQVTLPPVTMLAVSGWKPLSVMMTVALGPGVPEGVGVAAGVPDEDDVPEGTGVLMGAVDSQGKRTVFSRLTSPPGPLIQVM